ncbi:helix-turn-helix domain-containing protein [Cupriavidus sp. PET2-C1]
MPRHELDRGLGLREAVVEHGLAVWRAAEKPGLSRRQVERLAQRYRADGPSGLGSRERGRPS